MINYMPKYFYGGHNGAGSDKPFIETHISRLNPHLQKQAADQYDHLYLQYFNRKQYQHARNAANDFLLNFANLNGGAVKNIHPVVASEENKSKAQAMIDRVKRIQKETRPTIIPRGR